ncbi:MAG: hypothetical protein DWQ37_00055 [Planctomycetota bacterium]|nr:MAG: hypothetical protein DWQ37_00055 [Planctomycetota bacterium]
MLPPRTALAQVDTPAAREARAALQAVTDTYSGFSQWQQWSEQLNLPDVQFEVLAGESGNPAVLEAATRELLSGEVPQYTDPAFSRLAKALDVLAQQLRPLPESDWPSACREQAEQYSPVTVESLDAAREAFAERLGAFASWLPSVSEAGSAWNTFLYWDESQGLANGQPAPSPKAELLDRLETRWASAPSVWDDTRLLDASLAARSYIRLLRAYLKGETAEQHADAWNSLAEKLEALPSDGQNTSEIAAAVNERESLAQASRLTASIRRALSQPNLIIEVPTDWLEEQVAQNIDEPYDVDGVFAGTRSRGSGRMVAKMRAEILPSEAVGRWLLRINGTSTARTSGSSDRVYVVSRATTQVAATKPFTLDVRGLTPQRARAGANTSIVYEQIDSPGLARRRNRAIQETYARRPQAESESAAYARRSILEQINGEAAEMAQEFNQSYHDALRDPRINAHRPAPDVRVRAADDVLRWECRLEGPRDFAAASSPPEYDPGSDIVMSLAASAMEEQAAVTLAGRAMSSEELLEAMGPSLQQEGDRGPDDFHVTFEPDPCDLRFEDGAIQARLYITKFDADDVKYPAMTVDFSYKPEERDGGVVFVRQGRLRVTPMATNDNDAPRISGRQQTLKLAVQRKLEKVLTDELKWSDSSLPLPGDSEAVLQLKRARLEGPWLQLGLDSSTESSS